MKKIFLICLMSVCTVALTAQTGNENRRNGNGERRNFNPEQRYERLKQELNLSAKQLDSLKTAEKDLFAGGRNAQNARNAQRENESKEKAEQRQAEMKKRNDQFEKRLKNFLSDEQIAKYKELRNRNQRPQGNRDQAPPSQQRQNNREERNR